MDAALLTLGIIVGFLIICYAAGYSFIKRLYGCVDQETISDKLAVAGAGFLLLVFAFIIGAAIFGVYILSIHILQ